MQHSSLGHPPTCLLRDSLTQHFFSDPLLCDRLQRLKKEGKEFSGIDIFVEVFRIIEAGSKGPDLCV